VSRIAIEALFEALFLLTDIRTILRKTAPQHELGTNERREVEIILSDLEKQIALLKRELLA